MPVTRTYRCSDCEFEWSKFHMNRDEPVPDCPLCARASQSIPGMFAIGTVKGKAIDMAQKIAEEDFGLSNMADNQRAGDVAAKAPTAMHTAEMEAIQREIVEAAPAMNELQKSMAEKFWQHNQGAAAPAALVQQAMASSSVARAEGVDPISHIHEAGRQGKAKITAHVLGSTTAPPPSGVVEL